MYYKCFIIVLLLITSVLKVNSQTDISLSINQTDVNFYSYHTKTFNKLDHFTYVNYFYRNNNRFNNISTGYFLDYSLNNKLYNWNFFQTETKIDEPNLIFYNQLASGLGYKLINNEKFLVTINNGLIYRNLNDFRYILRLKFVINYKKFQLESFNHYQPLINQLNNHNIIVFQTLTYKMLKNVHLKLFYWYFFNNIVTDYNFQYLTIGFSLNLK